MYTSITPHTHLLLKSVCILLHLLPEECFQGEETVSLLIKRRVVTSSFTRYPVTASFEGPKQIEPLLLISY